MVHCFTRGVLSAVPCGSKVQPLWIIADSCSFLLPLFSRGSFLLRYWRPGQHATAKRRLLMPWFLLLTSTHWIHPLRLRIQVCLVQAHLNHQQHPNLRVRISLFPTFLASVVSAVKQALAAEQALNLHVTPTASFATSLLMAATLGGVPGSSLSFGLLDAQASVLAATSAGFSSVPSAATTSAVQGRPDFVVPAYVSTFAPPMPSFTSSTNAAAVTAPLSLGDISSLAQTSILRQPFVVSPGSSPVPAKLLSQIVAGKFVELKELLSANLVSESEPQLLFDGGCC